MLSASLLLKQINPSNMEIDEALYILDLLVWGAKTSE